MVSEKREGKSVVSGLIWVVFPFGILLFYNKLYAYFDCPLVPSRRVVIWGNCCRIICTKRLFAGNPVFEYLKLIKKGEGGGMPETYTLTLIEYVYSLQIFNILLLDILQVFGHIPVVVFLKVF